MTPEDFEAWLAHPITVALMDAARKKADAAKQRWSAVSWSVPIPELEKLDATQLAYLCRCCRYYLELRTRTAALALANC
jgi:hypothetical protein